MVTRAAAAMVAAGEAVAGRFAALDGERLQAFLADPALPDVVRQNRFGR